MSTTMAVEDLKLTLPELLDSLAPGDEVTRTTVPGTFSGRNLFRSICMGAVKRICRGERSDRFADSRIVLRIRL